MRLTPYESVICIFVYERLTIEDIERKLGKNRGALNKAIFRIKEKMAVRVRKNARKKIDSLGDFLRAEF